jgi:hypothetical protein
MRKFKAIWKKTINNTTKKGGVRFTRSGTKGVGQHQRNLFKNMRKNTRKLKATKKKTISKPQKRKGGFDSPRAAPRERSDTKGGRKNEE